MARAPRYVFPKSLLRFLEPDETGYPLLVDAEQAAAYLGFKSGTAGLSVMAAQYEDFPPVARTAGRVRLWYRPHLDEWRAAHPRKASQEDGGAPPS